LAVGERVSTTLTAHHFVLQAGSARAGSVSPAGIAILLLVLGGGAAYLVARRLRRARVVRGAVWDCGLPGLTAENEYTATAFSKPLRLIFSAFYRPRREIHSEYDVSPYYPSAIRFESEIEPAFETRVYGPLKAWIYSVSRRARAVQAGSVHAYLAYIFVTLIALLLYGVRQ
jgi:hydrogenase-4 component B